VSAKRQFPFFRWFVSTLTGRWARRAYLVVLLLLLSLTTAARLRSYFMARKIQAVLHGLAELRIDQTPEEQLLKTVPYLTRGENEWKVGGNVHRVYYAEISNESGWPLPRFFAFLTPRFLADWSRQFAYWLGYRYMSFDAGVLVQDGKVTRVGYGLTKDWGAGPRAAGYVVSAKSVHGFWLPHLDRVEVTSQDDESPQYRFEDRMPHPFRDDEHINVTFTNDAPHDLTNRAFQLDLGCFWSLRGCGDARGIAPGIWHDRQAIRVATLQRLQAGKCPDSIVEGRMRYLPDVSVLLLEVTGSRRIEVNEGGYTTEDWFTDYELKEVIRGRSFGSWKNVRMERTIPSPIDHTQTITNQVRPPTKVGSQVLFFGNAYFHSCRMIPATPSALAIVRKTPVPPKRPEDQIQRGLL
jgi:hypothetical protein